MKRHLADPRFSFLYLVISAVAVGGGLAYSALVGLGKWHTTLLLTGALLGAWETLFTFLEIFRIARGPNDKTDERLQEENPYGPHSVVVLPPTGDACPHHEDYPESAGLTEEQLLFRTPDRTPFIEDFLDRRAQRKQKTAR